MWNMNLDLCICLLFSHLCWLCCVTNTLEKKTYGHKYYVAASIGFEEKSYPFIRKMKWPTRALNLGVWGGFLPKFFVLIFGLSLDKICWLFHRPCIGLYRKQAFNSPHIFQILAKSGRFFNNLRWKTFKLWQKRRFLKI